MSADVDGAEVDAGRTATAFGNLRDALADLLSQEFEWTTGHLTALLNGCVFAPSLFTFWLVNGVLDFSTAIILGTVASPGGLQVRLLAYLLLVPVFVALRAGYYVLHPVHRRTVFSGACPQSQLFSLNWFSVGILATGLPLALQDLGPWLGMNAIFLVGVFGLPRAVETDRVLWAKLAAIALGSGVFLYANYGGALSFLPAPAGLLGPVATLGLTDATTTFLLRVTNSFLLGPAVIATLGFTMNRILTRPELRDIPLIRHSLPRRDPARVVVTSASLGTVFYLAVVAVATGRVVVVP